MKVACWLSGALAAVAGGLGALAAETSGALCVDMGPQTPRDIGSVTR